MTKSFDQQYEGGYYLIQENLIRRSVFAHTAGLENPVSEAHLRAVNAVQETPWRVNTWVLDVLSEAYNSGSEIGGIPYHDNQPIPRRTDEEWAAMTDEEKSIWKAKVSALHGENARMEAKRLGFVSKVSIAGQMRDQERMWFPHFLDFRLRMYPIPADLTPQSDDVSKGLLEFAEGKPLGEDGLYWLGVRLASNYGHDKLSFVDRYAWSVEHSEQIFETADNPLDGSLWWTKADEPWQFLAACREWTAAMGGEDVKSFVSHLPIPMDGTCNGLQHLSAMGRDPKGARATNVAANKERQDIYSDVANLVMEKVSQDAVAGVPEAHEWVGRVDRKTVKRAVMTTPYGVTARGISDQLIADGHTKGMEKPGAQAGYLRVKISEALEETATSSKSIMAWIQDLAKELSKNGREFVFRTPNGSTIRQAYYMATQKRVRTLLGDFRIYSEEADQLLNDRKQALASAPNVIHAFDAAHLAGVVNRMVEEMDAPSFAMVHDSFGCHASDVTQMNEIIRDGFAAIYEKNWLEELYQTSVELNPDLAEIIPHWSDYLELGDFDVNECRLSQFFFA